MRQGRSYACLIYACLRMDDNLIFSYIKYDPSFIFQVNKRMQNYKITAIMFYREGKVMQSSLETMVYHLS